MTLFQSGRIARFAELVRFYQSSIINTAFGYGLFALLIWIGLNIFVAQLVAHVIGTAFNYLTHSRHSFRSSRPAKVRFALAYTLMYLMSVALLALFVRLVHSKYIAGVLAAFAASMINYFMLKKVVFYQRAAT